MTKQLQVFLSLFILVAAVFWSFYGSLPHQELDDHFSNQEFSVGSCDGAREGGFSQTTLRGQSRP